ncbi:MAG: hypothetical protein J6V09_03585 [Clostridia bacterium]|nr:hypothetical protein [Clostridia bacterium]
MFDYTKAAFNKTLNDFKKFAYAFNVLVQMTYIGYLVYAICVGAGFLIANIILISVSVAYLIFYALYGLDGEKKLTRRITKRIYKYFKIFIKAVTLGATVYGIYVATDKVGFATIVLAAITTVGWVVSFVVTLIIEFFMAKWRFMISAFEADINRVKRPIDKVGNVFKRIRGESVEESSENGREQKQLDELRDEYVEEKKKKKFLQRAGK